MITETTKHFPADGATSLVLLGTKGGPRPSLQRSNPASLIVSGGHRCLVDCGYGACRQLLAAGVPPHELTSIFITHHHSDHTLELGAVLYHAWIGGRATPLDVWGPPPMRQLLANFFAAFALDIETRIKDEGRPNPKRLFNVHEIEHGGLVCDTEGLRVTAAQVRHPPLKHAFAFRFDAPNRSLVLSGDTAFSPELVRLARRADVLVHEVICMERLPFLLRSHSNATSLQRHMLASHTSTHDVGRVATQAEVSILVLNHLVPGDDPEISDAMWLGPPRAAFGGHVLLGSDLLIV